MRSVLLITIIISLSVIFSGCPYESNVPIDAPSVEVNRALLGAWKSLGNSDLVYYVSSQDSFIYDIAITDNTSDKVEYYSAYSTLVNGVAFLNIWKKEPGDSATSYYICKVEMKSEGIVTLSEVSDNITERFTSGSELKNFISSNMEYSYFFNKDELSFINEYQIVELSKGKAASETKLYKSKTIIAVMIGILALVLITSFILWFYFSNKRKTEKLIFEKREFSAILQGQDKERKRIASDLHDRLGSMLSAVKIYFNALEEHKVNINEESDELYKKANLLLDEACDEVRNISHDLASDMLLNEGLVTALGKLRDTISKTNQISVYLFTFGMDSRLDIETEIAIYSIIQEMMGNVLKHSKATEVTMQINRHENIINIIVEDNGIGFDVNAVKAKDGIGLRNIESRVNNLKGYFTIDSGKGTGTTMIINIPV